jgi:hypothetical protein
MKNGGALYFLSLLALQVKEVMSQSPTFSPTVLPTMHPSHLPTTTSTPTMKPTDFAQFSGLQAGSTFQSKVEAATFCAFLAAVGIGMGLLNMYHDGERRKKKHAKVIL